MAFGICIQQIIFDPKEAIEIFKMVLYARFVAKFDS